MGSVEKVDGLVAMLPWVLADWPLLDLQSSSLSWAKAPSLSSSLLLSSLSGIRDGGPSLSRAFVVGRVAVMIDGARVWSESLSEWVLRHDSPLSALMGCK